MPSLHRHKRSKFWFASFRDSTGRWRQVSTKTTDKAEALAFVARMESCSKSVTTSSVLPPGESGEIVEAALILAQKANAGNLGEAEARDFVNRLLKAAGNASEIKGENCRQFLQSWLEGKRLGAAKDTHLRYRSTVDLFLEALGSRADVPLSAINARDFESFRDRRLREVSASTVTDDLKILRTAFNRARRQGAITTNPCEAVDFPKVQQQEREPFTPEEVSLLLKKAAPEWQTMILLGFLAGLRLGDAASFVWESVDFEKGTITFKAQKTGRTETIPMHPKLESHLRKLAGGKQSSGPVSPGLAAQTIGGRSGLSRQFLDICEAAGLGGAPEGERLEGKRRRFSAKSFHSLRHGFVSAMAAGGVSPELRMKLSGHTSEDIHRGYTHHQLEALRASVQTIDL